MSRTGIIRVGTIGLLVAGAALAAGSARNVGGKDPAYGKIPVYFEQNLGQGGEAASFIARLGSSTLYLTAKEAVSVVRRSTGGDGAGNEEAVVRARLLGAEAVTMRGAGRLAGVSHYFIGNDPKQWRTFVPHFSRVEAAGVYPGIDLVYYPGSDSLEYDFIVKPGADPALIRFSFTGTESTKITEGGDLVLATPAGEIRHRKPVVYQTVDGRRVEIAGGYVKKNGGIGFRIGEYRRDLPLVVDPIVNYSTYLGGTGSDAAASVATDGTLAFIAGTTGSVNFPKAGTPGGGQDAFAMRLNAAGTAVDWATFIGGSASDVGRGIGYSPLGAVFVTGNTASANMPATAGAFRPSNAGFDDAFVTKLSSADGTIERTSYFGGASQDFGLAIAVDANGGPVIAGQTSSSNLPLQAPVDGSLTGLTDGFFALFNANLQVVSFASYFGGSASDSLRSVAVSGQLATLGGVTAGGLFTASGFQPSYGGGSSDGMFLRINLTTRTLLNSSYLGGSGTDEINGTAVDAAGAMYLTGRTASPNFPITAGAIDGSYNEGGDMYISKVTGTTLNYSTYLGGDRDDVGLAITVNAAGEAIAVGASQSPGFPTYNANQPALRGARDAVMVKLDANAASFVYSTFFGGTGVESAQGIALASPTVIFAVGSTDSTNLPTANPLDATFGGTLDGWAGKFTDGPPPVLVTFNTNPAGRRVLIDGALYTAPVNLGWAVGVSHSVDVENPQFQPPDQTYSWTSWDAPLTPNVQAQTVVTPGAPTSYTANFSVQTCTYAVAPNPASVPLTGGPVVINVTTSPTCPWTAIPVDSWLTGGGVIQTGSGSVTLTAAANPFPRTGTATVAFQSVSIAQTPTNTPSYLGSTPAFGSGANQTFSFQFEDPNGAADLLVVNVLVNLAVEGRNACYIAYLPSGPTTGTLVLVNDNGDAGGPYAGIMAIPGSGTISNSQCTINGSGSSASTSGNTLNLNLNMSFTAALAGNRVVYGAARDQAVNNSGWQPKGVWNVPGAPPFSPSVVSMTPQRLTGSAITLTTTLSDVDGFADLNIINILVNNAIDGRTACYIAFVRPANLFVLVNDAGDAGGPFAGTFTIPGAGSASNSQCTISATGASASGAGNNLTLTLPISFTPAFKGDRIIYIAPRDVAEHNPGFQPMGTITVP
jgi:hypothetical protein